jgi:hypothetical protein
MAKKFSEILKFKWPLFCFRRDRTTLGKWGSQQIKKLGILGQDLVIMRMG